MDLRCFIAIDVPEQIKKDLGKLIEIFKRHNADIKWVTYENLHITLKFLGKTPSILIPRIGESLSRVVLSYRPFCIKIHSVGVFPDRRYPKVIWVGVEDVEILRRLQSEIEDSMALLGYQKEARKFHPHLTLGRVRSQKGITGLVNELDKFKGRDFGVINVEGIKLMKSTLRPEGAEYSCLQDIAFGSSC